MIASHNHAHIARFLNTKERKIKYYSTPSSSEVKYPNNPDSELSSLLRTHHQFQYPITIRDEMTLGGQPQITVEVIRIKHGFCAPPTRSGAYSSSSVLLSGSPGARSLPP